LESGGVHFVEKVEEQKDNPDEAQEVIVVKYWLNAEEILASRLCGSSGT